MTGFELQISGFGKDRSTNWTTTTALEYTLLLLCSESCLRHRLAVKKDNSLDCKVLCAYAASIIVIIVVHSWVNLFLSSSFEKFLRGKIGVGVVVVSQWTPSEAESKSDAASAQEW